MCLRAIFESFQHPEAPRWYEGEQYRFTLLPPVFRPSSRIASHIAAVNPYTSRLAAEACDERRWI